MLLLNIPESSTMGAVVVMAVLKMLFVALPTCCNRIRV